MTLARWGRKLGWAGGSRPGCRPGTPNARRPDGGRWPGTTKAAGGSRPRTEDGQPWTPVDHGFLEGGTVADGIAVADSVISDAFHGARVLPESEPAMADIVHYAPGDGSAAACGRAVMSIRGHAFSFRPTSVTCSVCLEKLGT